MSVRITDQAEGIRAARRAQAEVDLNQMDIPKVIRPKQFGDGQGPLTFAVTSGKGGVGKTQTAANLGVAFAQQGAKVLLVDADLGLASMDLALGIRPKADLMSVIDGESALEDIIVPGPSGVHLIPACPGRYEMANLDARRRGFILQSLEEASADFDVVVVDTGAGIGSNAVGFAAWADEIILVATPDPTSLRDAYAMAKVLNRRSAVDRIQLVANQVKSAAEGQEIHQRMLGIVRQFLTLDLQYLGFVPSDVAVRDAVLAGEPCVLGKPTSLAARAYTKLAQRLRADASPRELC